jgi:hypothetical protein
LAADRDIAEVLAELGFVAPDLAKTAREELESSGLTRPGKRRLSIAKFPAVAELLHDRFARACSSAVCQAAMRRARPAATLVVVPSTSQCEYCAGSDNRRAILHLAELCRLRNIRRILVVGGSPSLHDELTNTKAAAWELRLVLGTERRTSDKAKADVDWAQLVLIWGGSELDHKVSTLYTSRPEARGKTVVVAKRGISALFTAAAEHLGR